MEDAVKEFRNNLVETLSKNQEDFEKQLVYVSAGTLGASMFLIDHIVEDLDSALYKWLLIMAWLFLGATLVVNAISHFVAMDFNYRTIDEIDKNEYNDKKALKRNKKLRVINISTIISLFIGLVFLILFTSINLTMSKSNKAVPTKAPKTVKIIQGDKGSEKLARTSTPPPTKPKPVSTKVSDSKK